jgi:hypothetical protein
VHGAIHCAEHMRRAQQNCLGRRIQHGIPRGSLLRYRIGDNTARALGGALFSAPTNKFLGTFKKTTPSSCVFTKGINGCRDVLYEAKRRVASRGIGKDTRN